MLENFKRNLVERIHFEQRFTRGRRRRRKVETSYRTYRRTQLATHFSQSQHFTNHSTSNFTSPRDSQWGTSDRCVQVEDGGGTEEETGEEKKEGEGEERERKG